MTINYIMGQPDSESVPIDTKSQKNQEKNTKKTPAPKKITEPNQEILGALNILHSTLEMVLYSSYGVKAFDFEPDDENIKQLAVKIENMAKLYGIGLETKTTAWVGFAFAVFTIYGTQIASVRMQMQMIKEERNNA